MLTGAYALALPTAGRGEDGSGILGGRELEVHLPSGERRPIDVL